MDLHEQRMQCLRMAFDLGGKPEDVISAAQKMLDFVMGTQSEAEKSEASAPEPTVRDPIAACGTALAMPESGELSDASHDRVAEAEDPAPAEETATETVEIAETAAVEADAVVASAPEPEAASETPAVSPVEAASASPTEAAVGESGPVAETAGTEAAPESPAEAQATKAEPAQDQALQEDVPATEAASFESVNGAAPEAPAAPAE